MLNIPSHVRLSFDPVTDPGTAPIFAKDIPRKLWLAWSGFGFLRSNHFAEKCLIVGERLASAKPRTEAEAEACFRGFPLEFRELDVRAFLPHFMPLLRGERSITWGINE